MSPERSIARREVPGTRLRASILGIAVDPPPVASPDSDRRFVALLRKARTEGVTVFDVANPRAERLVAMAFPEHDPELLVIVAGGPAVVSEGERSGSSPKALEAVRRPVANSPPLDPGHRRLAPQIPGVVEWSVDEIEERPTAPGPVAQEASGPSSDGAWSLRLPPVRETISELLNRYRPKLISTELSLLAPDLTAYVGAEAEARGLGVFVRDPFASGLLDGSRFSATLSSRTPRSGPADVRALRAEFEPVLQLGFLSAGARRTLPQSALQYLLARGWVTSVIVPLPRPERWGDVFGAPAAPPLTAAEIARVDGEAARGSSAGRSSPAERNSPGGW
jgi:aryl-alcohol dehydrogenase-like predicted oxidoreductase